jgi:hypothetical protein
MTGRRAGSRFRTRSKWVLAAIALVGAGVAAGYLWAGRDGADRQAEVAERGARVMAFDLERTTHRFEKTAEGGIQTVVADDADVRQVELVREHLKAEAERFRRGDFSDPVSIHGTEMPGVTDLETGAERIEIRYEDAPDGGRIAYSTGDPELVDALHAWFDAQVADHGRHAESVQSG